MINRIIGVLTLNVDVIEEIEHDENATIEAAIIVSVVAVLSAIGGFAAVSALSQFGSDLGPEFAALAGGSAIGAAVSGFINTFLSWVLWSAITFLIGTSVFNGKATMGEMLRVIGYAYVPQVLSIIPCIGLIAFIYSLVVGFVAIRQGLDLDNVKTAITIVISLVVMIVASICIQSALSLVL